MNTPRDNWPTADRELTEAVRRLRSRWRRRVAVEGVAKVAAAALLALIAAAILAAVFGAGSATVVTMRVLGYLLIAAAVARYLVLPVIGQPDDSRLALYVEERAPELKQALVSAVHELKVPTDERPSPALSTRVVEQALAEVRRIEAGPGLERTRLTRALWMFGGVAAAAALLLVIGPPVLRDAGRVLFIPWSEAAAAPVLGVRVTPGNAAVPRGGGVELRATLQGFASEAADLVLRSDTASEWVRIPMLRDSAVAEFTARLFDLTRPTEYFVESDGIRSKAFTLSISNLPAVQKLALELRFPTYTGLPVERIPDGGDVTAVRGTTVTVRATITMPAKSGSIRLDGGAAVPMRADSSGRLIGSFRVARDGFYRVDLVAQDGTPVAGTIQYSIEALEDRGPSVLITEPGRDTKATSVEEVTVGIRASDEYGVTGLALQYNVNGGPEQRVRLTDSTQRRSPAELRAAHTFFLEELGLKPGDLVSYFATATDGGGNSSSSDIYFLEIRPFGRDYKQAEEGGGGGGGGGGQSPEGLSARQREIVAGTFNWLRDSARTAERDRRENVTTLAIGQGRIKEDVLGLARRLVERNVLAADTTFRIIHAALDTAGREMQAAEERLGRGIPREALPFEQRALQLLQRAEAAYREVQVQMGQQGGGGGGGGSQSSAEDLADLFELETDKLQNQYESVQQEQQQTAQQEIDEMAERLKRLASRQQQENERMQRMADALRERLGQQSGGGGGGGGQQRQLAQEAEEEARRLERLSRERNSPELAEAARQMQQAADAMRRAASGNSGQPQQGNAALDRLRSATKGLENARSAQLSEEVRDLQRRGEEMGARQREISEGVGQLPKTSGTERTEQLRRLAERKDGLAGEVERLQADAERLARAARREQPGAAGKLGQAAEDIQETRLKDKITFSKNVMRSGSPEYTRSFEGQISENIADVTGRLKEAAGALSESGEGKRDAALERARELVRGLESLRERMQGDSGSRESVNSGSRESGNSGQQPGQGQGQGQGQSQGGQQQQQGQGGSGFNPGADGGRPGSMDRDAARQFSREFGLRRDAAEGLRRDLAGENADVADLDRIIQDLRRLESGRPFADPKNLEALQQAVIEGLKRWEFKLWRQLGQGAENRPAMGAPAEAPAEYRALVEEYYRSLARKKPPPPS
jgi:hypothetical protein